MAKQPSKCIFCGYGGELTKEHLISRRYHKYMPPTMNVYHMLRSKELPDRSYFNAHRRTQDPRDWQVKCVCGSICNNGWMRRLEDRAEPILLPLFFGEEIRLTPEDQTTVAAWCVMKAIVAEYEESYV